jgi:threonine dehydratase
MSAVADLQSPRLPIGIADVEAAAQRLQGIAVRTPLLSNFWLDEAVGARVLIKPEVLQHTGSFKFRGASNRLRQVPEEERRNGVVAWSSGNHAQGVAAAARQLGMKATIVMPADTPAVKVANTRALGATVVFYDRTTEDREAIGRKIAAESGAITLPPYDDPAVMAGQGTIGLEIAEDAARLGVTLDAVLAPCSGGGLISGVATAMKAKSPATQVVAVEPEGFDDTARSLASGARERNASGGGSICDALLTQVPGELTFAVNSRLLAGAVAVSDEEALRAVAFANQRLRLVVEPGGAVALAALLAGKLDVTGKTVAVVLSGGNIDPAMLQRALDL